MKKYMLFGYEQCYPLGGMEDLIVTFNKVDELSSFFSEADDVREYNLDEYQLLNTATMKHEKYENGNRFSENEEEWTGELFDWVKGVLNES
ncbi:hypothetical protein ABEY43_06870 [Priestia megaterium]